MANENWKRDAEKVNVEPPEAPVLCANKCGFFANSSQFNLCSKCYKDSILSKTMVSESKTLKSRKRPAECIESSLESDAVASVSNSDANLAAVPCSTSSSVSLEFSTKPKPNRCYKCSKRVGLTGFKCKCAFVFCSLHRYSENHSCSFDYKAAGRDAISKENPVIKREKIMKI